jgi:2-succinyl-6-hydroxy-2,4-cyclohexadiene-1-carboxylate synthase
MTVLLHGFWGQPRDWNDVINKLSLGQEVLAPDLYKPGPLSPNHELSEWTQNFLSWLDHHAGRDPVRLVGYSMGARLALNAVIAHPERFKRVLLLSAAALLPLAALEARAEWEAMWREKFLTQPWSELEAAWQDQGVFVGSPPHPRRRCEELRESLGLSIGHWSVRRHPFEWEHVRRLKPSVEWAFGALDQKYLEIAKTLQELPVQGQITLIPNARHRLITDASAFIANWIENETELTP